MQIDGVRATSACGALARRESDTNQQNTAVLELLSRLESLSTL